MINTEELKIAAHFNHQNYPLIVEWVNFNEEQKDELKSQYPNLKILEDIPITPFDSFVAEKEKFTDDGL